jgi:nitrate/nitrite transporter NarK
MKFCAWRKAIATIGTIALSCLLVFSFGLHTVQVKHMHPTGHVHGEASEDADLVTLDEYLHGTEKKLFFYILISFLFFGAFIGFSLLNSVLTHVLIEHASFRIRNKKSFSCRCYDYLCTILSGGILNPKAY